MKISELKQICQLVSMNGLIDEFSIAKDGNIIGIDTAKTAASILKYEIELPRDIYITNVNGLIEVLNKFTNDVDIEILDNKLHIADNKKFADIILKINVESQFKLPELTDDSCEIVCTNIDHNILNKLGKMRPQTLINELYCFYVKDQILMMRVGNENDTNIGDMIGDIQKCDSNNEIRFTQNIAECFKNIVTTANIYIGMNKLMMIECNTEKYNIKYYLAPRVD